MAQKFIPLTLFRSNVFGPTIQVVAAKIVAIVPLYRDPRPGYPINDEFASILHFVGGSTLTVSESPAEVMALMKGAGR